MRWAFTGIVRPALTYGALVWHHKISNKQTEIQLQKLNRLACNLCTNIPKSSPTKAIEIILGLPPLHLFILETTANTYMRLYDTLPHNWEGLSNQKGKPITHIKSITNHINQIGLGQVHSPKCYYDNTYKNFQPITDSIQKPSKHNQPSEFSIYTDGSKIHDCIGAGIVVIKRNNVIYTNSMRLADHASVFYAEMHAIFMAAKYISDNCSPHNYIKIFTDSQAALQALNKPLITDLMVKRTALQLQKATETSKTLKIVWVKAHVGNTGNELADSLAKKGAEKTEVDILDTPTPFSSIKQLIKDQTFVLWDDEWSQYKAGRQSRFFYPNTHNSRLTDTLSLSRARLGKFIRIITGHNALAYHRHNVDEENNDPYCNFCLTSEYETSIHLFTTCPAFEHIRISYVSFLDPTEDWTVDDIMDFADTPAIAKAYAGYENEVHYTT
jgi:ribonuclease HI